MLGGFSYSVMGASHAKRGIVCQDASAYKIGNGFAAAVVADGHGGKKYFRSNVGSRCAVEAALETIEHFYADPDEFDMRFRTDHNRLLKRIEKYAISLWNEKTMDHLLKNPLTQEEVNRFSFNEFEDIPPESYYGTTMVCAVMARGYSWGIQIGDGSLVAVFEDGEASMIMDYEEANPANITSSMCNANAFDMFASFYTEKRPVTIVVSTDGLYTSFGSDREFLDYHTIIAGQLSEPNAFFDSLKNNMEKRSHFGTEDDISVSCVFDDVLASANQEIIMEKIAENKRLAAERKAKLLNK